MCRLSDSQQTNVSIWSWFIEASAFTLYFLLLSVHSSFLCSFRLWRLFTFWTLPSSLSLISPLAYLALEPSSYSHPGSQSLSKGIFLSPPACSVLQLLHIAPVWERGFSPHCGCIWTCIWNQTWSPSLFVCKWQQTRDLRSIGLLSATVDSL